MKKLIASWTDNPIFVKHMRSRLRRSQFLPPAILVLSLCLLISYGGYHLGGFTNGGAFGVLLGLQSIILAVIGAAQVSTAVGGARESGIIDFHRVSPLSPLAVTLGFFFGAPVREYALFLLTIPFSLVCVANDAPSLIGFLQTMVTLFLSAWILHALSILTALSSKKPKAAARGIVGLFVFLFIFGGRFLFPAIGGAARFVGEAPTFGFFGVELPWLVHVLLYAAPALFFFLLASVRRMRAERAHFYTKAEAVACLSTLAVLVLGGTWGWGWSFLTVVILYVLVCMAIILSTTITPTLGEYAKGVRRAEREGRSHLSYWDDLALNRVALLVLCGIVLAGATIAWTLIEMPGQGNVNGGRPISYSITIATGVLVVAYVGLASQFFQLAMPRRGSTVMGLFLFLIWGVPLVVSAIAAAGGGDKAAQYLAATSPIFGLATSVGVGGGDASTNLQAAVLVPALIFVFLFNNLVTVAKRRAIATIHASTPGMAKSREVADPLAV